MSAAKHDRAPVNIAKPETFGENLAPYLVFARTEILANLRLLVAQHSLVTIYFDHGANFIITRLLGVNPEFEELIFDLAPDARTNEKLLASTDLTVVSFFNHIKIQFSLHRAEMTQFEGAPAFRARAPQSLLRLQRRSAFRVRTPVANSPDVKLPPIADKLGETSTALVRIADISATGLAVVAPAGTPVLVAGMQLPDCELKLKAGETYFVDIEIRRAQTFRDGAGREMCRAGCLLVKVSGTAEMAIQRYVNQLEVTAKNKR